MSLDPISIDLGLRARFEYEEVLELPRDEVPNDFRRPMAGLILLAPVLATTIGFLLPDFGMLSPDDDLPVFSLADRITAVEGLGMDTATSSLNRVAVDLRLGADLPNGASIGSVGVGLTSTMTASSFSAGGLDSTSRDDAGGIVAILEDLPLEPEPEPELDFFSIGGRRVDVVDLRFSFERVLLCTPAERGLVGVGVTELASSSPVLDEGPGSVGAVEAVGACEAKEVGDV